MMFISEFDRCVDADVHLLHSSIARIFPSDITLHLTSFNISWHCFEFIKVSKKKIQNSEWGVHFFSKISIQTDTVGNEILFWVGRDFQCIWSRGSKVLTTYVLVLWTLGQLTRIKWFWFYGWTHLRVSNGTQ